MSLVIVVVFLLQPFLRTILTHPSLFTTIVLPAGEGILVSYKTL